MALLELLGLLINIEFSDRFTPIIEVLSQNFRDGTCHHYRYFVAGLALLD